MSIIQMSMRPDHDGDEVKAVATVTPKQQGAPTSYTFSGTTSGESQVLYLDDGDSVTIDVTLTKEYKYNADQMCATAEEVVTAGPQPIKAKAKAAVADEKREA